MANYNSTHAVIEIDSTSGGSLTPITSGVDRIGGIAVQNGILQNTPYGTGFVTKSPTGVSEVPPFDLEGELNDSAGTASTILRGARADKTQRSFKFTIGGSNAISFECYVASFETVPQNPGVTRYKARIEPTGTITEA